MAKNEAKKEPAREELVAAATAGVGSLIAAIPIGEELRGHWLPGADHDEALDRFYALLGDGVPVQDEQELGEVVFTFVVRWLSAATVKVHSPEEIRGSMLDCARSLVHLLHQGPQPQEFSVPLSTHSRFGPSVQFGGRRNLRLVSVLRDDGPELMRVRLSGTVDALSMRIAADRAEEVQEEVAGALLAVGLASPNRSRPTALDHEKSENLTLGVGGETFNCSGHASDLARALDIGVVVGLSELERRSANQGDVDAVLRRKLGLVTRLVSGRGDIAGPQRAACRFFARACVTRDFGGSLNAAFMALETLLIPKSNVGQDVQARLIEAIVHGAATPHAQRKELRDFIREVYEARSNYVHSGAVQVRKGQRSRLTALAAERLHHEMTLLPVIDPGVEEPD